MKATDNFLALLAEAIKTKLKDLTFVVPRPIQTGDVVVSTDLVQFHDDVRQDEYDTMSGRIVLNLMFYGPGALFLVLGVEEQRLNVMCLEGVGRTGSIGCDHVKLFE